MNINEKAAYLKGLYDGFEFDKNSKEAKMIGEMLDLMSKMADEITALTNENAELREYIEEIDEDLGAIEEIHYFSEDEEDDEDDYDDLNDDEDFEYDDDSEYYELECPSCGEVICFDDSLDPDSIVCPACGEKISDVELCDGECENCDSKDCE